MKRVNFLYFKREFLCWFAVRNVSLPYMAHDYVRVSDVIFPDKEAQLIQHMASNHLHATISNSADVD